MLWWAQLVNAVSGVLQGSVLGKLLFLLYTSEHFSILQDKWIGYADDSTLIAVVPSPSVGVTVTESLSRDLMHISEWCDRWVIKSNACKTKTMIVSRSCTVHPLSHTLTIDGTVLKEYCDLVIMK